MRPLTHAPVRGGWRRAFALRALVLWACCWATLDGRGAPPTLTSLFPAGGQRGSRLVTTCTGEFSWPVDVWAPGIQVTREDESGKLAISIPEDLAADRVWIRLYNAEGASAAVPFLIGSLAEIDEQEPNNSPSQAQAVAADAVTINGVLRESGDVDGYAVTLSAGQTLVAAVDANSRLGSPMDAILQVATPQGTVVAENHDDVGLDPRLAYTASGAGTYVVRLFAFPAEPDTTIAFRGAANYIYRLTLTTGPFITHAIPMTVSQAEPGSVEVFGWNISPGTTLPVVPFGGPRTALGECLLPCARLAEHQEFEAPGDLRNPPTARLGFVYSAAMAGAARVRLLPCPVAPLSAVDDAGDVTTIDSYHAVTGCLRMPRQTDTYRLPLKQGQPMVISVESQSLDFPTVPLVRLFDPTGAVAAEALESGPQQDVVLAHSAAQDGEYRLMVADRYRHGGDRYFYRLTVRAEQSDFELLAAADAISVKADAAAELSITVRRRTGPEGAVGPITIEAVGLPEGVTAAAVVSEPEGPSAEKVALSLTTTGQAFSGPIRIRGTAQQPRAIERYALTPPRFAISHNSIWLTAIAK